MATLAGAASGDKAEQISNMYHPYQLGKSRLIEFTCAIGDTGKANVNRLWGYADDDDGLIFKLQGLEMGTSLISSVSGSVVETFYPQSQWNMDRMDGTGSIFNPTGKLLDVSKANIYWIDFQWLGAGLVRFGVNMSGKKIVCHHIDNANKNISTYMRTGSLPVYIEQKNTGTAASTSEMKVWCRVVKQGGAFNPRRVHYSLPVITKALNTTNLVPVISIKSKQTIGSINNRISSFINSLEVASEPTSGMIQISILKNATLTGSTYNGDSGYAVLYDSAATSFTGGILLYQFFIGDGHVKDVDLSKVFNFDTQGIRRKSNITLADEFTIAAKLTSAGTGTINISTQLSDM